jgi:hypothetical protein
VRGDLSQRPGSILAQIVKEISHATVVVADITGLNPNVFYELGIAHQLLGPERVVIIAQKVYVKQAYDVHQFRQLVYAHNKAGLASSGPSSDASTKRRSRRPIRKTGR